MIVHARIIHGEPKEDLRTLALFQEIADAYDWEMAQIQPTSWRTLYEALPTNA
jgi:hypothetical protein